MTYHRISQVRCSGTLLRFSLVSRLVITEKRLTLLVLYNPALIEFAVKRFVSHSKKSSMDIFFSACQPIVSRIELSGTRNAFSN